MWGLWVIAEAVRGFHFDNDCNSENYKRGSKSSTTAISGTQSIKDTLRAPIQCPASCTLWPEGCLHGSLMICPLRMLLTFVKHLSQGTNSPWYTAYIHSASGREKVGMILRGRTRLREEWQQVGRSQIQTPSLCPGPVGAPSESIHWYFQSFLDD